MEYQNLKKNIFEKTFLHKELHQNIEMIALSFLCFALPFMIGHPQWLIGTIVNASLVLSAFHLPKYKWIPVAIFPSLGVLTQGLLFGPFTIFLVFMIPFIWIGNAVLVIGIKYLVHNKNTPEFVAIIPSGVAKVLVLFSASYIFVHFGIIPALFLTTMGIVQLYTALAGGVIGIAMHKVIQKASE